MAKGDMVPGSAAAADPDDDDVPATVVVKSGKPAKPIAVAPKGPGFFTIYKRGQGKWTRLGTVFAAAALGLLTAYNLYVGIAAYLPVNDPQHPENHSADLYRRLLFAGCVAFLVLFGLLTFWLTNKPRNADFMIATDSEMKKVNWTTKGELLGSTRVVVLFLFFVATFLFVVDLLFAKFFHLIRVLQ
jgi:preprotein translocase SecE subunit